MQNEIVIFVGKQIELEIIVLSKISQNERQILCVFSHVCVCVLKLKEHKRERKEKGRKKREVMRFL